VVRTTQPRPRHPPVRSSLHSSVAPCNSCFAHPRREASLKEIIRPELSSYLLRTGSFIQHQPAACVPCDGTTSCTSSRCPVNRMFFLLKRPGGEGRGLDKKRHHVSLRVLSRHQRRENDKEGSLLKMLDGRMQERGCRFPNCSRCK
jgi:hypothetical protein